MNDIIDLGSEPVEDFDPFASEDELEGEASGQAPNEVPKQTESSGREESSRLDKKESEPASNDTATDGPPAAKEPSNLTEEATTNGSEINDDAANPIMAAFEAAETETAKKERTSLSAKPPIFEHGGAKEAVEDTSQTFDELRIAKSADFPELEDGKRVSWTAEYGKITKTVADAKGTSIAKFKSEIETSKAFMDALKKSKDKSPDCILRPKVTAQSKGAKTVPPAYKGIFANMDEAEKAQKTISIVPGRDGNVYEIRNTGMGRFTARTSGDAMLSDITAGFKRALPPIPVSLTLKVVSFFRLLAKTGQGCEAVANVYWDNANTGFFVDVPKQTVSKASAETHMTDEFSCGRYLHYMDIHSHNTMPAFFSSKDNADEKATRLYAVMGSLQNYFPEIKVRASNGGKFIDVDPSDVFECIETDFPLTWINSINFRGQAQNNAKQAEPTGT